jgi:hypothetical protein
MATQPLNISNILDTFPIKLVNVLDPVLLQPEARYAVFTGAVEVTNMPYAVVGGSTGAQAFVLTINDWGLVLDREMQWSAKVFIKYNVAVTGPFVAGDNIVNIGRDVCLNGYPLTLMQNQLSVAINALPVNVDVKQVGREILRLIDTDVNRTTRTCPCTLSRYASMNDCAGAINDPMSGFTDSVGIGQVGNGAWADFVFTDSIGSDLVGNGTYTYAGLDVNYVNGIPVGTVNTTLTTTYTLFMRFRSSENWLASPLQFSTPERTEGIAEVGDIKINVSLNQLTDNSVPNLLLTRTTFGRTITGVDFNRSPTAGAIQESFVNVLQLTRSIVDGMKPVNRLPYMEVVSVSVQQNNQAIAAGASAQLTSQAIPLPGTSDLLYLYAKPFSYLPTDGEFYLPFESLQLFYDGKPSLCASFTLEQLYLCSVRNGLRMSWGEWRGIVRSSLVGGGYVATCGGPIILKPGVDFPMPAGRAPGILGNVSLRYTATVRNQTAVARTPVLNVLAINSGFFDSIQGKSSARLYPLTNKDVLGTDSSDGMMSLTRMIGGNFFSSLNNAAYKMRDAYGSKGGLQSGGLQSGGAAVSAGKIEKRFVA